jgi:transposase
VRSLRVPSGAEATVAWLKTLPAPVRVVYEAGPTGYGLARACADAGISCVVAAPSRIRPAADRVKTDRRDAERLARLLRLGEITAIRVPTLEEEAARDLVRAREDARGDLMRARHRLSKLLLRHGLVYDATAWTRTHDAWLRRQRPAAAHTLARARGSRQAALDRRRRGRARARRALLGAGDDGVASALPAELTPQTSPRTPRATNPCAIDRPHSI